MVFQEPTDNHREPVSESTFDDRKNEVREDAEAKEKESALQFQDAMLNERWDAFVSSIIKKDFVSEDMEDDLYFLSGRLQKTKSNFSGLATGGWTRMIFDIAADSVLDKVVDGYCRSQSLDVVHTQLITPEREALISKLTNKKEPMRERCEFLEKLLDATTAIINVSREERNHEQMVTIVSVWSDILTRFKQKRLEACRQRLEKLLPQIEQTKLNEVQNLKDKFPDLISEAGLERTAAVKVWIADEYLASGTDWASIGNYNAEEQPPVIEMAGRISLRKKEFKNFFKHELRHAISGHGVDADMITHTSSGHILAERRVGIRENWLNEAFTEKLEHRRLHIPESHPPYRLEQEIWKIVCNHLDIDERDLWEWYFVEGDDSVVRGKLEQKYPDLFPTFERIGKISKGERSFGKIRTEDDLRALFAAARSD